MNELVWLMDIMTPIAKLMACSIRLPASLSSYLYGIPNVQAASVLRAGEGLRRSIKIDIASLRRDLCLSNA